MTARQGEIKFAAPAECVSASFRKNAKRRLFSVFKDSYLSIALPRHLHSKTSPNVFCKTSATETGQM